jgi:hypothetical protein
MNGARREEYAVHDFLLFQGWVPGKEDNEALKKIMSCHRERTREHGIHQPYLMSLFAHLSV